MTTIDVDDKLPLLDPEERQELKDLEDKIVDVYAVLKTTNNDIHSLLEKYQDHCRTFDAGALKPPSTNFDPVHFALKERLKDVKSYQQEVETQRIKLRGTIDTVRVERACS